MVHIAKRVQRPTGSSNFLQSDVPGSSLRWQNISADFRRIVEKLSKTVPLGTPVA